MKSRSITTRSQVSLASTVFFCFTREEAEWAVIYKERHPQERIKVLAPTLAAQKVLLFHGLPHQDFFEHPLCSSLYYQKEFKTISNQTQKIVRSIQSTLRKSLIAFGIPLIDVLQVNLEYEIFDVLYQHALYSWINKTWKPCKYFISQTERVRLSGWSPDFFSLAGFVKYFFAPKRFIVEFETYRKNNTLERFMFFGFDRIRSMLTLRNVRLLSIRTLFHIWSRLIPVTAQHQPSTDVLLFSGGLNLFYYHQLFRYIKNAGKPIHPYVLTGPQSLEDEILLLREGLRFVPIKSHQSQCQENLLKQEGKRIASCIPEAIKKVIKNSTLKMLPKPLRSAIVYKIKLLLEKHCEKITAHVGLVDTVITQIQPKLIITTHDPGPSAMPFVLIGKKKGINTLVLIHAWQDSCLGMRHRSRHVAAWGKSTVSWYKRKFHRQQETIHAVGFPFFDPVFENREAFWQHQEVLTSITHNPLRLGILLTLYPENNFGWTKFLRELIEAVQNAGISTMLNIRTHRGQLLKNVEMFRQAYAIPFSVNESISLEKFILSSDIIISWDTTAFLWAMAYGKPLFCTTPFWGKCLTPLTKYKAAWEPKDANDLVRIIKLISNHPAMLNRQRRGQRQFLTDVIGHLDGSSSSSLYKLIEKLRSQK